MVISAVDLADNDDKLREAYDPSQPTENLFHRFEVAVEYVDATKRPYAPDQLVSPPGFFHQYLNKTRKILKH